MIREIISSILLVSGFLFLVISAIGVIRLPDFFSRLHSSSIGETLGISLMGTGLIVFEGLTLTSAKILLIIVGIFIGNPVGTHLIGKAALLSGHYPKKSQQNNIPKKSKEKSNANTFH